MASNKWLGNHLKELVLFAIVGLGATFTHYIAALIFVGQLKLNIYLANFLAYSIAVFVSFLGHSFVTFKKSITKGRTIRFVCVSLSALALSQLLLSVLQMLDLFGYKVDFLVVVLFIPAYSYLLNKVWVYA